MMHSQRHRIALFAGVLALAGLIPGATRVHAQFTIDWPALDTDVREYTTVFECLHAVSRVNASHPGRLILRDTLPVDDYEFVTPLPDTVITIARKCNANIPVSDQMLAEFMPWLRLLLAANRDTDAQTLAQRWLALDTLLPHGSTAEDVPVVRATKLGLLSEVYLKESPVRFEWTVPLIEELQQFGRRVFWTERFSPAYLMFGVAIRLGDTVRARTAAEWMVSIADQLTPEERESLLWRTRQQFAIGALKWLHRQDGLDSLRKSTSAYVALQRSFVERVGGRFGNLGGVAPPLKGEFWFPERSAAPPPVRGRVTIIVGAFDRNLETAYGVSAMFRRLKTRFPSLDLVIATQTRGSFDSAAPPTPSQEAEFRRRELQEFYRLDATVVVEQTQYWHLPDPDRRRINEETVNFANYNRNIWLVDQDGIVVDIGTQIRGMELILAPLIEVLFTRHEKRTQ